MEALYVKERNKYFRLEMGVKMLVSAERLLLYESTVIL